MSRVIEPSRRGALASLVALIGALAFWSFGKWTDPVIDFGYELYVPWRLSEGDVLYREIAYRNGPLSSYWNALLFSIFGVSIRTLVVANLAILCATTGLLFALLERVATRYAALLGTALFLTVCAFSQYGNVGNYNFVTPYQRADTRCLPRASRADRAGTRPENTESISLDRRRDRPRRTLSGQG